MRSSVWPFFALFVSGCCAERGPDGTCVAAAQAPADCADDDETRCDDGCLDLRTDRDNCGSCGAACDVSQVCSGGECVAGSCECDCTCLCRDETYVYEIDSSGVDDSTTCTELEMNCHEWCGPLCGGGFFGEEWGASGECDDIRRE